MHTVASDTKIKCCSLKEQLNTFHPSLRIELATPMCCRLGDSVINSDDNNDDIVNELILIERCPSLPWDDDVAIVVVDTLSRSSGPLLLVEIKAGTFTAKHIIS